MCLSTIRRRVFSSDGDAAGARRARNDYRELAGASNFPGGDAAPPSRRGKLCPRVGRGKSDFPVARVCLALVALARCCGPVKGSFVVFFFGRERVVAFSVEICVDEKVSRFRVELCVGSRAPGVRKRLARD